jgi:hypothetical protein
MKEKGIWSPKIKIMLELQAGGSPLEGDQPRKVKK